MRVCSVRGCSVSVKKKVDGVDKKEPALGTNCSREGLTEREREIRDSNGHARLERNRGPEPCDWVDSKIDV